MVARVDGIAIRLPKTNSKKVELTPCLMSKNSVGMSIGIAITATIKNHLCHQREKAVIGNDFTKLNFSASLSNRIVTVLIKNRLSNASTKISAR